VVHPDRRVDEDHRLADGRRRRGGRSAFWVPPRAASRWALARAISASMPA
jgi:hypothetical protein